MVYLQKQCQNYNLSAMSVVFSIAVVIAGLALVVVDLMILSVWKSSIVIYLNFPVYLLFIAWLWRCLVLIGKDNKQSRTSDDDLIKMQAIFYLNIFGQWFFASASDRLVYHQFSLVFEWIVVAFHVIYFLLSLCVRVKLPVRSYLTFVVMLAVALFQTIR